MTLHTISRICLFYGTFGQTGIAPGTRREHRYQGRTGHRKSDQPGHNLTQPSPAQWPSKTHLAGLGQDDFVSANELAILTCQGPAR